MDAIRVRVRYDLPDETGETRRERATRFGQDEGPPFYIPPVGWYLWEWYWSLSSRLRRVRDGVCEPIPPSEFLAWCTASGTLVSFPEYAILSAMDDMFCEEMNAELQDYRKRQHEEQKQASAANLPWRRNR